MSRGFGRWQQAILRALDERPEVLLIAVANAELGRLPNLSESSGLNRAAHSLEDKGLCGIGSAEIVDKAGRAQSHSTVHRPGLSDAPPPAVEKPTELLCAFDAAATAWVVRHHYAAADPAAWAVSAGPRKQASYVGDFWPDQEDVAFDANDDRDEMPDDDYNFFKEQM